MFSSAMGWRLRSSGDYYEIVEVDTSIALNVRFIRWDRAEQVRQILEKNELDCDAAQSVALARMRQAGQP